MGIISPSGPLLERPGLLTFLLRMVRFICRLVKERKLEWRNPWNIE